MAKDKHFPPMHPQEQFHCPHCGVFAKQSWSHIHAIGIIYKPSSISHCAAFTETFSPIWTISKCAHCNEQIIWLREKIVYPKKIQMQQPNEDLAPEIKKDYMEAAAIYSDSPRAAAALLRLALQKLCRQLGEKGENINVDIKNLVQKGLNSLVQKSLDSLRITGNNAVHPGEINLEEEPVKVLKLFELINFIAEKMITEPKEIESFYEELPDKAKAAIEKRDGK
jgi:hypothetical protein